MEIANKVYLGLGSNLGNSKNILKKAVILISEKIGAINKISKVYASSPLNPDSNPDMVQPDYLNMVLLCSTSLTPRDVLSAVHQIENDLGLNRDEKIHWGPRIIDIDILSIGDTLIDDADFKVPHPEMTKRDFVLLPLQEIAPDYIHPFNQKVISELVQNLDKRFIKESFSL